MLCDVKKIFLKIFPLHFVVDKTLDRRSTLRTDFFHCTVLTVQMTLKTSFPIADILQTLFSTEGPFEERYFKSQPPSPFI